MSNAGLNESESNRSELRNIFDAMAYDNSGTGSLPSVKKWLTETHKSLLSSNVHAISIGDDSLGRTVPMKGLSQLFGSDVKARLLNVDAAVTAAYQLVYQKEGQIIALDSKTQIERKSKFQDVLKDKIKDLVLLEACAGSVPEWVVLKNDVPKWLQSIGSAVSTEIRKQLETGNTQILLQLNPATYCLKNIISVLSAVIQVDGPVIFFLSPNTDGSTHLLLPILNLIDAINSSRIRNRSIDVLLLSPDLLNVGLLKKLDAIDITLKRKKPSGVIVIDGHVGDKSIPPITTAAAMNLSISNGRSVHYVVDSSADILSAVSSIVRNTWSNGIEINHRCRSLVFVHQPVYAQVIYELKNSIEKMKINSWNSNNWTNCDFVTKQIGSLSSALSSVNKLGAKILSTKSDYTVPTVVYDMGTSSDLVATKESGLGHILCLIPYRSSNELFSLGNNFGVPDQVFLYSNCITTSMNILRKLNASEILVNSASPPTQSPSLIELSWQVVSKSDIVGPTPKSKSSNTITNSAATSAKWRELSTTSKIEKLGQVIDATEADPAILLKLLSFYLDTTRESSLCIPSSVENTPSGIILGDASGISISSLLTALIACSLRDKPVVVVSVGTELPSKIAKGVKDHLPLDLVSFVTVETVKDIASLSSNWELTWVFQGTDTAIELDFVVTNSGNRTLLVNNPSDKDSEFNAKIAIASAYKNCYI